MAGMTKEESSEWYSGLRAFHAHAGCLMGGEEWDGEEEEIWERDEDFPQEIQGDSCFCAAIVIKIRLPIHTRLKFHSIRGS